MFCNLEMRNREVRIPCSVENDSKSCTASAGLVKSVFSLLIIVEALARSFFPVAEMQRQKVSVRAA